MADFTTAARPYAKAVFEMAQESSKFEDWSGRLEFWSALVNHPEMSERLEAPGLTQQDRATMIETVVGDGMDDHSRNFVRLLSENNRLALLPDIHAIFEELRAEAEGEIEATVTSAFELTEEQRDSIIAALSKRLDRKVRIVNEIDKDLIGGAIIRAGDLVIDGSLKGRVENMERLVVN
ncbi:MAG: F-type H+-transporting ATPase subunit delta [Granulosicoccus sp.]|jgi:F-type H+-transporting ATPase subunit delta